MKAFRILNRCIRDSFKSVMRNISLSMASIVCTTITLILVAIAIIVTVNVNNVTTLMEEELTVVVFVNKDATSEEVKNIENELNNLKNKKEVVYKSKEERKLEMQNSDDGLKLTLDYLSVNPLQDSFIVTVLDVDDLAPTAREIRKINGVESAEYGEGTVEEIVGIFDVIKKATIVIVIALVIVTAFLISNTIKLTIFSRRNEIEIMRLVGSSNTAIKLPFIFEGFLLGIVGSLVPIILTIYGYMLAYEKTGGTLAVEAIKLVKPVPFVLVTSLFLLVIGAIVGMFGSAGAVRKYLKI